MFSWLTGRRYRNAERLAWQGCGEFHFDIVGESHYQEALAVITGGKREEGHEFECTATLVPERGNPHDRNAVAVYIEGRKVGHLSRADAAAYRDELKALAVGIRPVHCQALIVGGWDRGHRGSGHFGVKLDLAIPLTLD